MYAQHSGQETGGDGWYGSQVSSMPRCMAEEGCRIETNTRRCRQESVYKKHNNGRKNEVKTKVIIMKVKLLTLTRGAHKFDPQKIWNSPTLIFIWFEIQQKITIYLNSPILIFGKFWFRNPNSNQILRLTLCAPLLRLAGFKYTPTHGTMSHWSATVESSI